MTGLVVKLIVCPLTIFLSDALFPQVYYPFVYQPILIGIIVAIVAYALEVMILKRGTLWISTFADFIGAAVIVYFVTLLLPGATITVTGALLTALVLALTEHIQHIWLISTGRTKESDQRV